MKRKFLLLSVILGICVVVSTQSVSAVEAPPTHTIDCSVRSTKVCVTVENGPYTTTYKGKAKEKSPETSLD